MCSRILHDTFPSRNFWLDLPLQSCKGGMGLWTVKYTSSQGFINTFVYYNWDVHISIYPKLDL